MPTESRTKNLAPHSLEVGGSGYGFGITAGGADRNSGGQIAGGRGTYSSLLLLSNLSLFQSASASHFLGMQFRPVIPNTIMLVQATGIWTLYSAWVKAFMCVCSRSNMDRLRIGTYRRGAIFSIVHRSAPRHMQRARVVVIRRIQLARSSWRGVAGAINVLSGRLRTDCREFRGILRMLQWRPYRIDFAGVQCNQSRGGNGR